MTLVLTIGHSTCEAEEFVALVKSADIRSVVDVRAAPTSRRFPHFNGSALSGILKTSGIGYIHLANLGGHRSKSAVPPETNAFWTNQSFHNYADYAMSDQFRLGLEDLIRISQAELTAIMCAEAVWWRCHRRIIADYLLMRGIGVKHILGHKIVDARMTPAAQRLGNVLCYSARQAAGLP